MSARFEMVCRVNKVKDGAKIRGWEVADYQSGWTNHTLHFNAIAGDNRFLLRMRGGKWKNGSGDIYLIDKNGDDFKIPFEERLQKKYLNQTAEWRKRVVDLEQTGKRSHMKYLLDHDDDEAIEQEFGDRESLQKMYDESLKKRHEFLSDYDFVDFFHKVIEKEEYKNSVWLIRGEIEFTYSANKGRFYKTYVPQRIYLANSDAEFKSEAQVTLLFDKDSLDDSGEDDIGKSVINGFVSFYDNQSKGRMFAPYQLMLYAPTDSTDSKQGKAYKIRKNRFIVDENDDTEVYELGVTVKLIDGAQRTSLKVEDLPEDVQEAILIGDISERDALAQYGNVAYGDRITENRFAGLMRGYANGRKETLYKSDEVRTGKPTTEAEDEVVVEDATEDEEDYGSLFDDI